ncbi:hypothetical protein GURASL_04390 [Geotalea uraniireducens]|uniref:Uncharacterized protein n=1 Tax=Geotalea uraniireducens TaxID=351604 RepID=A0ABM8EGH2_9BACT|nr:hypothetical protein [Geotalea uraniireducens]BDV41516.1 hypothetical protein GURASL_04390 [Geotalea uraniireducens]
MTTVMAGNALGGTYDDAKSAGTGSAQTALSRFGSQDGSNQNISQPLTSPTKLLQTLDGSQSFQANITSPSSAKFLEVFIQPAGTGDLQKVIVSQYLDTNGTFDYVYTLPRAVSGVCGNGYIACDPGTWNHCQYFKWTAGPDGKIADSAASITDLGGCYCINQSCGSNLVWANSAVILQDLGGGIVNAIHNGNSAFTITSVNYDLTTIDYFGRVTGNSTTASGSINSLASSPTVSTLSGYYTNWAGLTAGRDNAAIAQSTDPNSLYYLISNSGASTQASGKMSACTVKRNGAVQTTVRTINDSGTGQLCTDHLVYIKVHKVSDSEYQMQYVDTGPGGLGTAHSNCGDNPGGNGWHTIKDVILTQPDPNRLEKMMQANLTLSNISGPGCSSGSGSVDGIVNGFDTSLQTSVVCPASGAQFPTYNWSYYIQIKEDQYGEGVDNQCATLENDPDCRLQNETVDGVQTMLNFNATGLTPLPSCRQLFGQVGINTICRNWWQKKRTYVCGNQAYDFSAIGTRFGKVTTTVTDNTSSLDFQDKRLTAGGWSDATGSFALPGRDQSPTCEQACKTRKPKNDTQVTVSGDVTEMRNPATSYDFFYRVCDRNNVCPAGPGEEIVKDCQCINDFNEAATIIQTLRTAGKDTICTSGAKKPL